MCPDDVTEVYAEDLKIVFFQADLDKLSHYGLRSIHIVLNIGR